MGMLDGKVAAVTGGGRGIGRGVSKLLAAHGAAVVVNDLGVTVAGQKETQSPADEVVKEIKAAGGKASSNHMDISTVDGGEGLINQAIKEFGQLDILVNVAGILRDRMIFNMSEQEWDDVIRVHLKGHYCTMRPGSAHMRERKYGRIINFSSNSALGSPGSAQLCRGEGRHPRAHLQRGEFAGQVQHYRECDHARRLDPHDRYHSGRQDARRDRHSPE